MKVLFDFDGFRGRVGGVQKCTAQLIKHFPKEVDYEVAIAVCDNIHLLDSHIVPNVKPCRVHEDTFITSKNFTGKSRIFSMLERMFSIFPSYTNVNKPLSIAALKKQDFDIFHCPSTTADTYFLDYLREKPFVLTVHDMISELISPPNNPQSKIKSKLVPLASHIVTVSQKTKEDLIQIMNVPEEKITVIYHGAPSLVVSSKERLYQEPYYLYVGQRRGYKNFKQTLIDFAVFHRDFPEVKFVVTGIPFSKSELNLIRDLGIQKSVEWLFASEEELVTLYKYAIGFVYPSLYEGFGLPILEAFTYNCPVLLNDTSCFPEIAQNAAVYFHSRPQKNESNLPEVMKMVYMMSSIERDELIKKGIERCKYFNWEESSRQLAEVYRKVLY